MRTLQGTSEFERTVIEHILKKEAPHYIKHLPHLMVDRREYTGAGIYVYFKYTEEPSSISSESITVGKSVYAQIYGLECGVGFMLYIDEGHITMLESFTHGPEVWPAKITRFEIQDLK